MGETYETISGDTWDYIAKKVYGSEMAVSFLMSNNQSLLKYFIFPEGIILYTPELPETEDNLPLWRD